MLTVVIATENDEERLAFTLAALVPAAAEGCVREVIVVDAGSTDATSAIADATGCVFIEAKGPVGERLRRGAEAATRGEWLLFLPPGAILEARWEAEAGAFVERAARSGRADACAAVFSYGLDDMGLLARLKEVWVATATSVTGLPHPAQGLLISRGFYRRIGGFRPLAALEDVDIYRRIGRFRIVRLRARATGGADRWPSHAASRTRRAVSRLLAACRVPPRYLVRLHG
ncbi:glycosyltransferase [Chthonobacter albigriseus]|uniref:glycosyltransferase n=1 Tax=Chthonobacter albigriseus TaxID=1683161 RepID=UPI0015EE69DD|nr:glycosyltransferase [Chthonobacter albigriseus]